MTPLEERLIARIRATGPITIADFMTDCLLDPDHGYYTTRDPLGASGDFTTSPEVSQMFGELMGLSLAQAWMDRGTPERILLAELGPGRGTLMADVLRATSGVPGFHAALDLHLIEASPTLRARQTETIRHPLTHHDRIEDLPDGRPLFVIANEFFDALPIRQFQRTETAWRERVVGLTGDQLAFGLSGPVAALPLRLGDTKPGEIVETSPASNAIAATLGARIAEDGGVALIIDYGDWRSRGDTFQAVANHEPVDPLAEPGNADLTAHVDFEALAQAASPAAASAMTPQGVFLERLGITPRAEALARNLTGPALESHIAAHRRLTHPKEMGTLFKVLALYQPGTPPPPGVDPQ